MAILASGSNPGHLDVTVPAVAIRSTDLPVLRFHQCFQTWESSALITECYFTRDTTKHYNQLSFLIYVSNILWYETEGSTRYNITATRFG